MPVQHISSVRDEEGVVAITIARPDVFNAFDEHMIARLTAALRAANSPEVRCVLLTAAGKHFCAGADIGWMKRASAASTEENLRDARSFADLLDALFNCPVPVITRVQGDAFGLGVGLAAASDIVICADEARFCVSEAKLGIIPAVIGPYLIRSIGHRQALRIAMEASRFGAAEALQLGLVHRTAPLAELESFTEHSKRAVLSSGPQAVREIKSLYHRLSLEINAETREVTASTIARIRASDEAKEGFAAFQEKRKPRWGH